VIDIRVATLLRIGNGCLPPGGIRTDCRWPESPIPAVCSSTETLNMKATPAMSKLLNVRAAAKAANFAEISEFKIFSWVAF
jgi:hypothetical protein